MRHLLADSWKGRIVCTFRKSVLVSVIHHLSHVNHCGSLWDWTWVSTEEEHLNCGINHSFVIGWLTFLWLIFYAVSTSEYTLSNGRTGESEQIWMEQSGCNLHTIPTTAGGLRKTCQILRKDWDWKQVWCITTTAYLTNFLNIKWNFNKRRLK